MWKQIVRVALLALALFALYCVYLLLTDTPLTPQAKEWFGTPYQATLSASDNAWYALNGFSAPQGMNPDSLAQAWTVQENERMAHYPDTSYAKSIEFPKDPLLIQITAFLKAHKYNLDSLNAAMSRSDTVSSLQKRAMFLDARFNHLAAFHQLQTPLQPITSQNNSLMISLLGYMSFRDLWLDHLYDTGQQGLAIAMLADNLRVSQLVADNGYNVLTALVGDVMLLRNLNWGVDHLLNRDERPSRDLVDLVRELPLRSPRQYSLRRGLHYEARMAYNTIRDGLDQRLKPTGEKRDFWRRLIGKPHATQNLIAKSYARVADLSELSGPEFMKQRKKGVYHPRWSDHLRSLFGTNQANGAERFVTYIGATQAVNGYILLLKAKAAILDQGVSKADVPAFLQQHKVNYYDWFTGEPLTWTPEKNELSFPWPEEDEPVQHKVTIHFAQK